jgi:hypothetical protein
MAFPTLGTLDAFNRANENPLGNSTWAGDGTTAQLQIDTNVVIGNGGGFSRSVWQTQLGPDLELYFLLPSTVGAHYVGFGWSNATLSGTGYYIEASHTTSILKVIRWDGSANQLGADVSVTFSDGDSIGIERIGSGIEVYRKTGGTWSSIATRTDGTYTSAGYVWLGVGSGTSESLDDFGGGTIAAGTTRRPSGLLLTGCG